MKGKALGVANKNWRNNHDDIFCPGCREIREYFREHKDARSCKCEDCKRTLLNIKHGGCDDSDTKN